MARRKMTEIERAIAGGDFESLARSARWERLAAFIARRWRLPPWFSSEDVRQELLVEAWLKVQKFDPARGVTPDRYVQWNAITAAKKKGHKARGSYRHRHADAAPSRFELAFTGLAREGDEDGAIEERLAERLSSPPEQHELVERRSELRRIEAACRTKRELVSVRALGVAGGSIEEAARLLYDDLEARYELRLVSEDRAEKVVRGAVRAVLARLADEIAA